MQTLSLPFRTWRPWRLGGYSSAGFAIVDTRSRLTGEDGVRDMAEFFIARRHRRCGVGEQAARTLFDRFGGRWEVRQTERNTGALAFWRKVIGRYTNGAFDETARNDARWRGTVQAFVAPTAGDAESVRER